MFRIFCLLKCPFASINCILYYLLVYNLIKWFFPFNHRLQKYKIEIYGNWAIEITEGFLWVSVHVSFFILYTVVCLLVLFFLLWHALSFFCRLITWNISLESSACLVAKDWYKYRSFQMTLFLYKSLFWT